MTIWIGYSNPSCEIINEDNNERERGIPGRQGVDQTHAELVAPPTF